MLNKKSTNDLFGVIVGKVFLKPCLFLAEGVVGDMCCSGISEIWSNLAINIFQQIDQIGPRVPQGRPTSVQWDPPSPPRVSEKQVAKQTRYQTKVSSNWVHNRNHNLKVWRKLGDLFWCFYETCSLMVSVWIVRLFWNLF